jgi:putative transposase
MERFQNKYRIPSARLQNWDYGSNGAYFITICTKNKEHYFGNEETQCIDNHAKCKMNLNELGKMANDNWEAIPNHFTYVELGSFVIMPNHMHGILIINKIKYNNVETRLIASPKDNAQTQLIASPQDKEEKDGFAGDKNPMLNENISRIIRWYKGRCSFEMRKIHADFEWLSRYHDHIIRDSESFETIQNYIENNQSKWNEDKFNTL